MLARGWLPSECALLLAPHHGSESVVAGALLDRLRPEEVWISASRAAPLEAALRARGIPVRSTHRRGALSLRLPADRR